jgi:hypothetical protein
MKATSLSKSSFPSIGYKMILNVDLPAVHNDGRFIPSNVSRIVELVREYDSRLDVKWIPPSMRDSGDPAFAIIERLKDGKEVIAFYVQDESEFDERVLERILLGDNAKHNVQARVEAQNLAVRAVAEAKRRDERAAFADFAKSIVRSPKHTYMHEGRKLSL